MGLNHWLSIPLYCNNNNFRKRGLVFIALRTRTLLKDGDRSTRKWCCRTPNLIRVAAAWGFRVGICSLTSGRMWFLTVSSKDIFRFDLLPVSFFLRATSEVCVYRHVMWRQWRWACSFLNNIYDWKIVITKLIVSHKNCPKKIFFPPAKYLNSCFKNKDFFILRKILWNKKWKIIVINLVYLLKFQTSSC